MKFGRPAVQNTIYLQIRFYFHLGKFLDQYSFSSAWQVFNIHYADPNILFILTIRGNKRISYLDSRWV